MKQATKGKKERKGLKKGKKLEEVKPLTVVQSDIIITKPTDASSTPLMK